MTPRMFLRVAIWLLLTIGAVQLGLVKGNSIDEFAKRVLNCESLCGMWGCYPPIQTLASLHILWFLILMPLAYVFSSRFRGRISRNIAWAVFVIGLAALAIIVVDGWCDWYFEYSDPDFKRYMPQRAIYSLANDTTHPAIQITLAGLLMIVRTRFKHRISESASNGTVIDAITLE